MWTNFATLYKIVHLTCGLSTVIVHSVRFDTAVKPSVSE